MAQKVAVPFDFSKLEAINFRFQNLSTPPSSPADGQAYYDTDTHSIWYWNANTAAWVEIGSGGSLTQEQVEDIVGAMFTGSTQTRIVATYQDGSGKVDLVVDDPATPTTEQIQDIVGQMFSSNTETGISVDYQDSDGTVDFVIGALNTLPAPAADLAMAGFKITGLGTPTADTDAATKAYVDAISSGLDIKASVRLATAAALPAYTRTGNVITASGNGALTVDGVAAAVNDRLLVKDGAAGSDNGIYIVTATGGAGAPYVLTRAADSDSSAEVTGGMFTFVNEGTVNADSGWVLSTNDAITLNTTSLAFTQFSGAGQITAGAALTKTGNTLDVAVDGSTIEVSGDALQVKDAGITDAKLASTFTKKYSATIGDNSAVSIGVTHNLGTRDVQVQVYDAATYDTIICDVVRTSTTVVTLGFAVAPATNSLRVVVIG